MVQRTLPGACMVCPCTGMVAFCLVVSRAETRPQEPVTMRGRWLAELAVCGTKPTATLCWGSGAVLGQCQTMSHRREKRAPVHTHTHTQTLTHSHTHAVCSCTCLRSANIHCLQENEKKEKKKAHHTPSLIFRLCLTWLSAATWESAFFSSLLPAPTLSSSSVAFFLPHSHLLHLHSAPFILSSFSPIAQSLGSLSQSLTSAIKKKKKGCTAS